MLRSLLVTGVFAITAAPALAQEREVVASGSVLDPGARLLSQKAAVRMALSGNPALESLMAEARRTKWSVVAEENRYQFVLGANASVAQSHAPRLETNDAISSNLTRSWVVGAELSRQLSMGTVVELRLQGEYFQNEFGGGFTNPTLNQSNGFGSTLELGITQPLLRGAGIKNGEFDLRVARTDAKEADATERRQVSTLIRDTLLAYGELWYAAQAVAIENASLQGTQKQYEEAQAKVRTGSLSAADALSFATQVAEGREALVSAQSEFGKRALDLQELLGKGSATGAFIPSEEPSRFGSPSLDELERALEHSSVELAELQARVEAARVQEQMAGEDLRPRLDAGASIRTTGLGETPDSALGRTFQFGWVTGMVTLEFEAPLGSERRKAQLAQARETVLASQSSLEEARNRIATDARRAQVRLLAAEKNLELAEETRRIAELTLAAELKRYFTGTGVGAQVREAADAARRARLRAARARVDVSSEELSLQHLCGGLLREVERKNLL